MQTIEKNIKDHFQKAIQHQFDLTCDPIIRPTARPELGDLQANFALSLAKKLQLKPQFIAQQVVEQLAKEPTFAKLEVSGPGFINIFLADAYLIATIKTMANDARLGVAQTDIPSNIVLDYGGANIAKEMHVGHLRSLIIGDAIGRILNFVGHRVIPQNHLGDWGTQFGMLIEHLLEQGWNNPDYNKALTLNELYREAKVRFDEDNDFAERAKKRVVLLQGGDSDSIKVWQQLVHQSAQSFQAIYQQLGVNLTPADNKGESYYNDALLPLVNDLVAKNLAVKDQGAIVIPLQDFKDSEDNPLPFIIQKQDGGFLYATTDLAAIHHRFNQLKADTIIYVVDARQKQHFAMLFDSAKRVFQLPEQLKLIHVAYGSVLNDDNKPLKTRSGESVHLRELLCKAEEKAAQLIEQKHTNLSSEELSTIAHKVGVGALKYADLRNDKIKDYVFNWEKMLAFEGNTGPYLQNAYVRIMALFRKAQISLEDINYQALDITMPEERSLVLLLTQFNEVILNISINLQLHSLCDYLYKLARAFHVFYENCPVLKDTSQENRLALCALTANTLKLGLNLLGIIVVDKM